MKIGTSCATHEVDATLKLFDYAEVWDKPVPGHAYHSQVNEKFNKEHLFRPYVVVHTSYAPEEKIPNLMVENEPGEQPDHVLTKLFGNDFLLDVGHAFSSNLYRKDIDKFDFDRWFALKPKALHLHDCRIDIQNPWLKPDAADHQMLGNGILPLRQILRTAIGDGVLFCTIECFLDGYRGRAYSPQEKREAFDKIMKTCCI